MSLTKFKTMLGRIEPVEVERETKDSVWVRRYGGQDARRASKQTGFECYYDTWEDAHAALMAEAQAAVNTARKALEYANGKLGNVKGMKKPEPVA